jgi:PAS domain-containing protein
VLIQGVDPRRPFDQEYSEFVLAASRLLSASLASIKLHEEDIARREQAIVNAEILKSELRQQLLESQKEADWTHSKFQRFAERSDIGIFILDMEGIYSYRNDAWYTILSPDDRQIPLSEAWTALIDDEYIPEGQAKFEALAVTKQHQYVE